jgi:diguanylate cyclase (GGDEF)-like protein
MADRAFIVDEDGPVAAALQAHLEAAGFVVDRAPPDDALARLRADHSVAVVRAEARELAVALKQRDQTLGVLALHRDDDALAAAGDTGWAIDGALVGPLSRHGVAAAVRPLARLAALARRVADLERTPAEGRETFELHRRLVLMELKRARRYRYPIGLGLVAIDDWGEVAAPLGADDRAELLRAILSVVARGLRSVDLPVLQSGDRFLVVLPHTGPEGAMVVGRRLCERIASHPGPPRVTASVGVACFEGAGDVSLGSLVADASRGLDRARAAGGNRAERGGAGTVDKKIDFGW